MLRRLFSILGKAILVYAMVGFLILPTALHLIAFHFTPKYLTVPLQIGGITFNPFTLRLGIQAVKLGNDIAKPVVGFNGLTLNISWASLREKALILDDITLTDPVIRASLKEDGSLSFMDLLKPSNSAEQSTPSAETNTAPIPISLNHVAIKNGAVDFIDFANTEKDSPFHLDLDSLDIKVTRLTWPDVYGDITLEVNINRTGSLTVSSHILDDLPTKTHLTLRTVALADIQPYLTPYLYSVIESGSLTGTTQLKWNEDNQLAANSDLTIENLKIVDSRDHKPLVGWDSLSINDLAFSQKDNRLAIEELAIKKPATRIVLSRIPNQGLTVNLAGLVKETADTQQPKQQPSTASTPPMEIAVQKFSLEDGALDFSDTSFKPGFSAPITGLKGEIEGFNSRSPQSTSITFTGAVDKFSPVNITARLVPEQPFKDTEVALSFQDIELTTLTPYSGRFAGYKIRKGRMDVDLDYAIEDSRLNARNNILLHDLMLGDHVASENSTSLPLKLAIALLKDRNGRIDVDLPISGDLDNPEFQLGSVIRMAVVNFITNIVAAPFDMLASLVSGDADDMSALTFAPGSPLLTARQKSTIHSLTKALNERPELDIEIEPTASKVSDAPVIAQQQLQQQLISLYKKLLSSKGMKAPAKNIVLPDDTKLELLKELATQKKLTDTEQTIPALTAALLQNWKVSDSVLRKLAISRAQIVKEEMIQQGLATSRVYILGVELKDEAMKENVFMHLQGR